MARELQSVLKQIEQLQRRADALRAREKSDVVGRIKEAIAHYKITPDELFGTAAKGRKRASAKPASRVKPVAEKAPAKKTTQKKKPGAPIYTDGTGLTWTGRGPKPGWFKDLLAVGKTPEDLLIKS
jgi:DNA-binding protein H-NS